MPRDHVRMIPLPPVLDQQTPGGQGNLNFVPTEMYIYLNAL